jgi:hypothetical protein
MAKRRYIDKVFVNTVSPEYNKYFVVLRSNRRVSDRNHVSNQSAENEAEYWRNILRRWPDGTKISVIGIDNPNCSS